MTMKSVAFVTPTLNRPDLHGQLYEQFRKQTIESKRLYVYDESKLPSPFFTTLKDPSVVYVHKPGKPREGGVTRIGAARNALNALVEEEVIIHVDDDDILDPEYAKEMLARLGDADLAKLVVWRLLHQDYVFEWDTREFGGEHFILRGGTKERIDVTADMTPEEIDAFRDAFLVGFGWSLVYLKSVWEKFPFPEEGTEDIPWMRTIRDTIKMVFIDDCAHLALHTVHVDPNHAEGGSPHFPQKLLGRLNARMLGAAKAMDFEKLPEGQPISIEPGKKYRILALIKKTHSLKQITTRAAGWGIKIASAQDNVDPQGAEVPDGYRLVLFEGEGSKAVTLPWQAPKFLQVLGEKSRIEHAWIGAGAPGEDEDFIFVWAARIGAGHRAPGTDREVGAAAVEYVEVDKPKPRPDGHVCSAASSQTVARQLDPRWTYAGKITKAERDKLPLVRRIISSPVGGEKSIPTWTNNATLVLQCPYSGELFRFRLVEQRSLGAGQGVSSYFTQQPDGSFTVNTEGIAHAFDEKTPNFGDALERGLIAGVAVETVVTLAIGATSIAASQGIVAAASLTAAAAAGDTAASATLLSAGSLAGGAALAAPFFIAAVALAAWPAQSGPGCCGTDTSQPFGTCDPGEFNDWTRQEWVMGSPSGVYIPPQPGSAEEFLDNVVRSVFSKTATCWSVSPPLGPVLLRAVKAWNTSHQATQTRTISRTVNNTVTFTFGGQQQSAAGQPQDAEPISVALNDLAVYGSKIPPDSDVSPPTAGSTMSFVINDGPLVPAQLPPFHPPHHLGNVSQSHPVRNTVIAVGATAAAAAAGVGIYAWMTGQAYGEAWKRVIEKALEESRKSGSLLATARPRLLLPR